jgi:diguanylate cyclase (GGDEF)-like protein/PAS domain S-box-containing protein
MKQQSANKQKALSKGLSFFESFELISSAASVGLIITDSAGCIITFNKTIRNLFGFELETYKHTNVGALYANPDDRKRLLAMLAKSGTVRDFEVEVKHADGSLRTVLANVDYIEYEGEHVLLTSLHDVTQFIRRHTSWAEMNENYRVLFSNAPVGITVTDVQGKLVISNNAIRNLLGYTPDDLRGMNVRDVYASPQDRAQLLSLTKELGSVRDFETLLFHKDKRPIAVLINTDIIEFDGKPNMLLTSIRDISYMKRTEDELKKERDFSNAILNIAATLIVVVDCSGTITRFNRACEQASEYSADEIIGTRIWDINLFDPPISSDQIDRFLDDDLPGVYDTVVVSKSGVRRTISWTFAAIMDEDDTARFIIATGIDITKRKEAEIELQRANNQLASRVQTLKERTQEMNLLNEMGEQLQSCQNIEEACTISIQYIQLICPHSSGSLYIIKDSRNLAESVGSWGENDLSAPVFDPLSCWAIRRGRRHLIDHRHPGLLCGHITGPKDGQYLCVPLAVNGIATGILHLNHIAAQIAGLQEAEQYTEHKTQIVNMVAEHIALALANLKLKESLRQQSIRDALTGLFNRRYMEETLERELSRADREGKPVGVIMFDIDHFKQFNDLSGHDAGDALLRELGAFLNQNVRGGDIVCRYGGEEFLAVLPGADIKSVRERAEELRLGVKNMLVYHLGKPLAKCTVSLGVAMFPKNASALPRKKRRP